MSRSTGSSIEPDHLRHRTAACALLVAAMLAVWPAGCASSKWVTLRSTPQNPLIERFGFTSSDDLKPSDRTMQLLRLYHLGDDLAGNPERLLEKLQAVIQREPSLDKVYAFSELSYLAARKVEPQNPQLAMDLYGNSVLYAYQYLFDSRFSGQWNPYDPQFRGACNLYNGSLEAALRLVCAKQGLMPGQTYTMRTTFGTCDITCVLRGGRWQNEDFDHFEFVSDYEVTGLRNHYRTYGLGVPLIAVRRCYQDEPEVAKYYPIDLSFPVTALLRPAVGSDPRNPDHAPHHQAVLEIYDPLTIADIAINRQRVPLESDLSTPLACFLSNPTLEQLATVGLLWPETLLKMRPDRPNTIMGLYMMQPYEPGKIPVLFVHGLWSSPMTWMQMFNDLRNHPEIRRNYQFWFYLYPTGQPFWISAAQLRRDLADARKLLDPGRQEPALDQMVLVGHSMGGLVSRLQTIDSRHDYWNVVSDKPFGLLQAEPELRRRVQECFFFRPNPSIRRVITIATPHRGSRFSNNVTQWLASKLITLPQKLIHGREKLLADNRDVFRDTTVFQIQTGIDSLSPDSPIFPVMLASRRPPWVKYHNIVGLVPKQGLFGKLAAGTDGLVARQSARVADVESELVVEADHSTVLAHPLAVLEVRRILLEHVDRLRAFPETPTETPTIAESPTAEAAVFRR